MEETGEKYTEPNGAGNEEKILGVLGGMGPEATALFLHEVVAMTDAATDQDHVNVLAFNHAAIPDRTEHLKQGGRSPVGFLQRDARLLEAAGCSVLAMPCNTASAFWEDVQNSVDIPLLDIVDIAAGKVATRRARKVGILATEGTLIANRYGGAFSQRGIDWMYPCDELQSCVGDIIYRHVKAGVSGGAGKLALVLNGLRDEGCDAVVLGCTELSVAFRELGQGGHLPMVIDSLEELAIASIRAVGKCVRLRGQD